MTSELLRLTADGVCASPGAESADSCISASDGDVLGETDCECDASEFGVADTRVPVPVPEPAPCEPPAPANGADTADAECTSPLPLALATKSGSGCASENAELTGGGTDMWPRFARLAPTEPEREQIGRAHV